MKTLKSKIVVSQQSFGDRFFQDKSGKVVVGQAPNLSISCWIVLKIVMLFLPGGHTKTGFGHLADAVLFVWAYLELFDGVNYFRRVLGFVVMVSIVVGIFV
jgi:hypothetical protein